MENNRASEALKAIRKATGLSLEKMAARLDIPIGTYRHYEERHKGPVFLQSFVRDLLASLSDYPELTEQIQSLGELPDSPRKVGFDEGESQYAPHVRGRNLLAALERPEKTDTPDFKIGSDGKMVQIVATVDKAGIDELIRRLNIMKQLLD